MSRNAITQKLARIRLGGKPRVLDLFSGCGGISLGFHSVGFNIAAALEFDPVASKTHAYNFHRDSEQIHSIPRDITKTEPSQLVKELNLGETVDSVIDVIVGGPPCQAYSRVGRAKLREVKDHPEAFLQDPRGNLYQKYLQYVKEFKPVALLMENVPDMIDYGGHNVPQEVCEILDELGYQCKYTLLNSAFFGVPQLRERMFLIGFSKELGVIPEFPQPTHWIDLPNGYKTTRRVAQRALALGLFDNKDNYFVTPPESTPGLPSAISAKEALNDLPTLTLHLEGKLKKGIRRFDQLMKYPEDKYLYEYGRQMRNWPGFENSVGVYDHVMRYLPRDYQIFRRMNPGDEYPEAFQHAMNLFSEELERRQLDGMNILPGTPEFDELKKKIVPPYDPKKFANKWRKMESDLPARTLMAHLGRDGYSHIHYDSEQARTITPREAARLQSFPDGFVFRGSMDHAFRQIGNAVPPLLARTLAGKIAEAIGFVTKLQTKGERGYEHS